MTARGIGASVLRNEDERLLRGRGQFIADIALPDLHDVAFLRSPVAHARIRSIDIPDGAEGRVFAWAHLTGVKPIRAAEEIKGIGTSEPAS